MSNRRYVHLFAGLLVVGLFLEAPDLWSQASASVEAKPAASGREVISEAALKKQMGGGKPMAAWIEEVTKAAPVAATGRPSLESSLYRKSIILFDGKNHTVVPVGSVLHLPPAHRNKILEKPQGPFTFWPAFLERNENWLGAWEVPLRMALGDQELAASVLSKTSTDSRLLVSVYRGGPISILVPVEDPEAPASAPSTAKSEKAKP